MIITMFVWTGDLMMRLFYYLFSFLNIVIPDQISSAITYFISYLTYLGYVFPINTLMQATGTVLSVYAGIYVFRMIETFVSYIPGIKGRSWIDSVQQHNAQVDAHKYGYLERWQKF